MKLLLSENKIESFFLGSMIPGKISWKMEFKFPIEIFRMIIDKIPCGQKWKMAMLSSNFNKKVLKIDKITFIKHLEKVINFYFNVRQEFPKESFGYVSDKLERGNKSIFYDTAANAIYHYYLIPRLFIRGYYYSKYVIDSPGSMGITHYVGESWGRESLWSSKAISCKVGAGETIFFNNNLDAEIIYESARIRYILINKLDICKQKFTLHFRRGTQEVEEKVIEKILKSRNRLYSYELGNTLTVYPEDYNPVIDSDIFFS